MQIPRFFSHCYGMPTLAKPERCTCFHKLSYCNSALSCKAEVWDWARIHTWGRFFIPIPAVDNWQLNSAGAGGDVLQVGEAPHLSWQSAESPCSSGNLSQFSHKGTNRWQGGTTLQPAKRAVCVWSTSPPPKKPVIFQKVCCLPRGGPTQSRARKPSQLPTTC